MALYTIQCALPSRTFFHECELCRRLKTIEKPCAQPYLKRILDARIYALAIETLWDEASLVSSCMGNRCAFSKFAERTIVGYTSLISSGPVPPLGPLRTIAQIV